MQNFVHNITNFFTPKATNIIKTKNECGESRYIELSRESTHERRDNLDILLTKSKQLLSFVMNGPIDLGESRQLIQLIEKIQQSMYKNDDTTHLFREFEQFENKFKISSKSVMNLSDIHWG